MKQYIKEEIKRAVFSLNMLVAILLCFFCIVINFVNVNMYHYIFNQNAFSCFNLIFHGRVDIVFFLFAPLIASLPYSSSYAIDKKNGYINNIFIRIEKRKYFLFKFFINGIIGGSVIAISLTIVLIILLFVFKGIPIIPPAVKGSDFLGSGAFSYFYNFHPIMFSFICILTSFSYGFIFATIGLAISTFIENTYFSIVFPFVFPMLITLIFGGGLIDPYISPETLFYPMRFSTSTKVQFFISEIIWFCFSIGLLIVGYKRKVKNYV